MILPLGAISPDTGHPFPYLYGLGYSRRVVARPTEPAMPPVRTEIKDTVLLSPAAQRILNQAERLSEMKLMKE